MFHLHVSNRTEALVDQLTGELAAQPRRDPMVRESFLVQSHGMEQMLSQRLAAAQPVWCNMEYLWPARFFERLLQGLAVEGLDELFSRESLSWRIDDLLRHGTESALAPLRHYLSGDNGPLKRFQLARQVADLYDQYQIMRPEMLAAWKQGRRCTGNSAEGWQMEIWRLLLAAEPDLVHRGERLTHLIQCLEQNSDISDLLPSRLMVFGLHSLPPLLLSALRAVARHTEVHFFLLAVSRCSWEESVTTPQPCSHPLLLSCGGQAREFQELLLDSPDLLLESRIFVDPGSPDHARDRLLHLIQSDLLTGAMPLHRTVSTHQANHADDSLIIASCHSPLRELMALKDQILCWLDTYPEMEPSDVVVMAPDIQLYAPLISAVFAELPHSIADRSLLQSEHPGRTFLSFLTLLDGRFGWSDVMALLENPAVYPTFGLSQDDLDLVRHWVLDAGIRWGLSDVQCHDQDLPEVPEVNWQEGLDRLFLGFAMRSASPVEGVLPYSEIEGGAACPLGGLGLFVDLLSEAQARCGRDQSLTDWSALLLDYSRRLLGEDNDETSAVLARILLVLAECGGKDMAEVHNAPVSLAVIRYWLERQLEGEGGSAGFLRGRLTFCSMLPMRSIPFRAVCLLGLNDGAFPRADQGLPFDLLTEKSRSGDRSRRSDDRYQFLEALTSAREFFYLSYVGRSARNNEEIPPSLLISELLDLLRSQYQLEPLFRSHHLHPFARDYFRAHSTLFSYDREAFAVAQTLAQAQHQTDQTDMKQMDVWWQGTLPEPAREIDFADLCTFFANPWKWFVRRCLGIRLDSPRAFSGVSEPFELSGLDRYSVEGEIIQAICAGQESEQIVTRLMALGRWPQGTPGRLSFADKFEELKVFVLRMSEAGLGVQLPSRVFALDLGSFHLSGRLGHLHEHGQLLTRYGTWGARDLFYSLLHHLVMLCLDEGQGQTLCLTKDRTSRFTAMDDARGRLVRLLEMYVQGCCQPSPLLAAAAVKYFKARLKSDEQETCLAKAMLELEQSLEKGREEELSLLCRGFTTEEILGADFVACCEELFPMIREAMDEH